VKRTTTRGCAGALIPSLWPLLSGGKKRTTHSERTKEVGRKLFAVAVAIRVAVSSFGVDLVGHSVKTAGKKTYKAAKPLRGTLAGLELS